jgi:hypothetical protein
MKKSRMLKVILGLVLVAGIVFAPGCDDKKGSGGDGKHDALIKEFEGFQKEQCACKDYDCSMALGKKIGPRIQEVMGGAKKIPPEIQIKLGAILTKMTECAESTKKP